MTYDEIIKKVSIQLDLPITLVDKTYKTYWKVVRDHIASLPLKEELTDKEFLSLQPNVNIPSLGKFYVTLERYRKVNLANKYRLKKKKDVTCNQD